MNTSGIIGGVLAGAIGATIWAAIAYFTGYEIGYVAWGVGALVGFGCVLGARSGSPALGVMAVVITLVSIVAGKYAAVKFSVQNELSSEVLQNALNELEDDEVVISYLADEIVTEQEALGRDIEWPNGVDPEEATRESDYPRDIWKQATRQWNDKSLEEQDDYRAQIADHIEANIQVIMNIVSKAGFMESFGVMDILFFLLAVSTAFKIASPSSQDE